MLKFLNDINGKLSFKRICGIVCLVNAILLSWNDGNPYTISLFVLGSGYSGFLSINEQKK